MSAKMRKTTMDLIIAECHGNVSLRVAVEAAHRLGYAVTEIGSEYFIRRVEEEQA